MDRRQFLSGVLAMVSWVKEEIATADKLNSTFAEEVGKVASISALRGLRIPQDGDSRTVIVDGIAAPFIWSATDTRTDNGATVVTPNSAPAAGRWNVQSSWAVDPRWFGAKGDGTNDDTSAIVNAKATGLPVDLFGLTYRITSRVTFDQSQEWRNGSFLYDGPATDRLADFTANNLTFRRVTFDGNGKQVHGCLTYIPDNVQSPRFVNGCRWTNILGAHIGGNNNQTNNQYGIIISPYGVTGAFFEAPEFENIKNTNTTAVGAGFVGGGFCGGMLIGIQDDFSQPTAAQPVPTQVTVVAPRFKNIITLRDSGLSTGNQDDYNDADGIRFYGDSTGATTIHAKIIAPYFEDCSKRAIKVSGPKGVQVYAATVVATANLQYPMTTVIKLDQDMTLDGLTVYAPSTAPVKQLLQSHDGSYLRIKNIKADYVGTVWEIAPGISSTVLTGFRVENIVVQSCTTGIRATTAFDSMVDCIIDGVTINADPSTHGIYGIEIGPSSGKLGLKLDNIRLNGAEMKLGGYGYEIGRVEMTINDASYVGTSTTRMLWEVGYTPNTAGVTKSRVLAPQIEILAMPDSYFSASRTGLGQFLGDYICIDSLGLIVPETMTTSYGHFTIEGSWTQVARLDYSGPGTIYCGPTAGATYGPYKGLSVVNARRYGGSSANGPFLFFDKCQAADITDIKDERDAAAGSVRIDGGTPATGKTYAYIVDGVRSATSATSAVYGAGISLASVSNAIKY